MPDWALGLVIVAAIAMVAAGATALASVRARVMRDRQAWTLLERLGPELVGQADEAAILRIALADAPRMFGCHRATVRLERAGHRPAIRASVEAVTDEAVDVATLPPEAEVVTDPGVRYPLPGVDEEIGYLVLDGCRSGGARGRDRLAAMFAHMLSVSLGAAHALGEERQLVRETEQKANQDDLTTLGNRWLLDQWGDHLIAVARAQGRTSAMLLMDADDFKRINDTLGHSGGDRVLAEMGRRIQRGVRESDLAVRLGGDEFAVLTADLHSPEDAELLATRLLDQIARPVVVDDVELSVQASLGIAIGGEDGDTVAGLLRAADEAMYDAKSSGHGQWRRAAREPGRGPRPDRERIAAELRQGLLEEQLVLHYQPQVDARTGEVCGFEALARWQHPDLGLLTPAEFVPVAERTGLMRQLTSAVLDRALGDHDALAAAVPGVRLGVNVSARNLLGQGLVEVVSRSLAAHEVSADLLTLEVSEPSVGTDSPVAEVLGQLAELGCRISVSEYGTGRSSLTALAHLPGVGEIKLSPALVGRMVADEPGRRLVAAIATAAHSLGVTVVAEGVESVEIVRALRGLGCDVLQGFHVRAPAPRDDVLGWVEWWPHVREECLALTPGSS